MAAMLFREENEVRWVGSRPAHLGEQVLGLADATNTTATIYTVPASSVLFLTGVHLMCIPMTVGSGYIYVDDGAAPIRAYLASISAMTAVGAHAMNHATFWPPLELPAGYRLRVYSSAAGIVAYGTITGWVESV